MVLTLLLLPLSISLWVCIIIRAVLLLKISRWWYYIHWIFLPIGRRIICIFWEGSFWMIRYFFWSVFWRPIRLDRVGHLRIYSIIWSIPPLIDLASRFIGMNRWMLLYLKAGEQEIYAANSNFFDSLHFIVDRNSQTIIDCIFIKVYNSFSDQDLAWFWWKWE